MPSAAAPPALSLDAPVGPPDLPTARNRPADVRGVETALNRTGYLGLDRNRRAPGRGIFDSRLDDGIRAFQRRNKLKVDGMLTPKGPTRQALGRILQRMSAKRNPAPPLKGLSGEAYSANARLIRHLMTTTQDGIVPALMAGDFRANEAGRAKTADFLSQMFARDPGRARGLHAKARVLMEEDENSLLDRLILQARKADQLDEEDAPEPEEPPTEPEPEDPPKKPDPEEPPKKPKPDEEKCNHLKVELANAEQAAKEAAERMRKAAEDYSKKSREVEARWQKFKRQSVAFGIGNFDAFKKLRKGEKPKNFTMPSEVWDAWQAYQLAREESKHLVEKQKTAQAEFDAKEAEAQAIRDQIKESGCE